MKRRDSFNVAYIFTLNGLIVICTCENEIGIFLVGQLTCPHVPKKKP